jgi:hypothetical protein
MSGHRGRLVDDALGEPVGHLGDLGRDLGRRMLVLWVRPFGRPEQPVHSHGGVVCGGFTDAFRHLGYCSLTLVGSDVGECGVQGTGTMLGRLP